MNYLPTHLASWRARAHSLIKVSFLMACLFWSATAKSQQNDKFMNQRDFERAVTLYGGSNEENLEGWGCRNKYDKHRPNMDTKYKTECRIKYASRLNNSFSKFPVILHFKRTHHYYGQQPLKAQDTHGVYIYRFDSGKLENKGDGVFRLATENTNKRIQVRTGEVVSWSLIISNLENIESHEKIPYKEVIITPLTAKIHHCSKYEPDNCDHLNIKKASWGLCEGRVKQQQDGKKSMDTSYRFFEPMTDTFCHAEAIIDDESFRSTIFARAKGMGLEPHSIRSIGNQWVIEDNDPAGAYRIEVRISGKLVGALDFEVVR
jgi:hypothetical protein